VLIRVYLWIFLFLKVKFITLYSKLQPDRHSKFLPIPPLPIRVVTAKPYGTSAWGLGQDDTNEIIRNESVCRETNYCAAVVESGLR